MKYIDDYGNEFNTLKEVKAYAIQNLYENNENFILTLDDFVTSVELLSWIIENPTIFEKFKEDFAGVIRVSENSYAKEYFDLYCEKVED